MRRVFNGYAGSSRSMAGALVLLLASCNGGGDDRPEKARRNGLLPEGALADSLVLISNKLDCFDILSQEQTQILQRLCAEVVPLDGKIWLDDSALGECHCNCPGLLKASFREVLQLREYRRVETMVKYRMRIDSVVGSGKLHPGSKKIAIQDSLVALKFKRPFDRRIKPTYFERVAHGAAKALLLPTVGSGAYADAKEAMLAEVVERFKESFPIFKDSIVRDSPDDVIRNEVEYLDEAALRAWTIRDGELPDAAKMVIMFPDMFIYNPNVGRELMAFMLAHELGHVLGELEECMAPVGDWPAGFIVSEAGCDYWGSLVALRRVFTGREYLRTTRLAMSQLRDLYVDTDRSLTCGVPNRCCDELPPERGYPPGNCRANTIRSARMMEWAPACTTDWFSSESTSCTCHDVLCGGTCAP